MKKRLCGKILGLVTVFLLVLNLFAPYFLSLESQTRESFSQEKEIKKINPSTFQLTSELLEENFEEDVEDELDKDFTFLNSICSNYELLEFSSNFSVEIKKQFLDFSLQQSVPKWLFVRHILI